MAEQVLILIDKQRSREFSKFIELFKAKPEISLAELRAKIQKNAYYDFILVKLNAINESIRIIRPDVDSFISPALCRHKGRVVHTMRRNCNIEIIDKDPNFFYLRLKEGGFQHAESQI